MSRSALAMALVLVVSGCGDHTKVSRDIVLEDGGYALVEVVVPASHSADIVVSFEGAGQGESFAVFDEPNEAPFHVGWFDMSRWTAECERDPRSPECQNVHSQNAGVFVGVGRRTTTAPTVTAHCECTGKHDCTHYYAVVAGERGPERMVRVTVITETGSIDASQAAINHVR